MASSGLLLQTVFFHVMDSLATMVLGFQSKCPQRQMAVFLFVPDKNSSDWRTGASLVVGQPCGSGQGLIWYQKRMRHCPRSKTRGYRVFVSVTPSSLGYWHTAGALNVYWRKWMNNESLPWNVPSLHIEILTLWDSISDALHWLQKSGILLLNYFMITLCEPTLKGTDMWKYMIKNVKSLGFLVLSSAWTRS